MSLCEEAACCPFFTLSRVSCIGVEMSRVEYGDFIRVFRLYRQGFQAVYLSTHDKQAFYEHLGYKPCGPVTSLKRCGTALDPAQVRNSHRGYSRDSSFFHQQLVSL